MELSEQNRENVFHERASILRDQGYRGFTISKTRKKWDGVQVTAKDRKGRTVKGTGETDMEAYSKIIDKIDLILDEPH